MSILIFLVILMLLILVHEFGHFIVAKKSGMRVDEFGIGFPPKLFGKKVGETEYSVNALPFGGFVRIFGENPGEEVGAGDEARSFTKKSKFLQAAVLVAGVGFNVLFAWVLFSIGFMIGMPTTLSEETEGQAQNVRLVVTSVLPDSPAGSAGLMAGDEVRSLTASGETIENPTLSETLEMIDTEEEIAVTYDRGDTVGTATVTPVRGLISDAPGREAIGVSLGMVGELALAPHVALVEGAQFTYDMLSAVTVGIVSFFANAITFNADFSQVTGPVGIVGLVGSVSELGLIYLLSFTAFISLNLAVINLLPFPALDGGRLLFVIIEAIKGSPIKPVVANALNTVGFALLILLMLVVTYNDIVRLVG